MKWNWNYTEQYGPIQVKTASLWFNIKILIFSKNVIIVMRLFEIFLKYE